ncbi:MAG: hypothetical protein GX638_05250, partial [Crenarchaeota archaeon]|nr:hypothetical protein [Thermoproteota archaeon]
MFKKPSLIAISVLLVFAIVFSAFALPFASSNGEEIQFSLKDADRNYYCGLVFQKLVDSFPRVLILDEGGEREVVEYPQDYAGAYIDESDNLHIVLTKDANVATKDSYFKIMGYDDVVVFDVADFSLSFLREVQRTLDGVMQEFSIEFTGVDHVTNRLDVGMLDSAKSKSVIEFLKTKFNDFDDKCIIFKGSVGIRFSAADTSSNALIGSNCSLSTGTGTLGFNAWMPSTGQFGVVTAAHFATSGTTIYNALGTLIGSASVRQCSGTVDAAFIPLPAGITESYSISGYTPPDDFIYGYFPNAYDLTGMNMFKKGSSSGLTYGQVTYDSISVTVGDITFTDQVKLTNIQLPGDSGGPVFW